MNNDFWWLSSTDSFPHWWQVDLGRIVSNVYKFCFNSIDDVISILVKDYELSYSLDGTNFTKIYSGTYKGISKPSGVPSGQAWQTEECEFDPVSLRYFKITVLNSYDTRGYKWTALTNCLLYATNNNVFFLDKNNYIYGCK